jgi:hypothetical protein
MQVKWRQCSEAEREHQKDIRQYAHTYHYPETICVCAAFWDLPKEYRDGVILHEIGHLIVGPRGSEAEATRAAEAFFDVEIRYVDSPYGKRLERLENMGAKIINRQRVMNSWSPMEYQREREFELRRKPQRGSYWVIGQMDDIPDEMRGPFQYQRDAIKQMQALKDKHPTYVDDYGDKVDRYLTVKQI